MNLLYLYIGFAGITDSALDSTLHTVTRLLQVVHCLLNTICAAAWFQSQLMKSTKMCGLSIATCGWTNTDWLQICWVLNQLVFFPAEEMWGSRLTVYTWTSVVTNCFSSDCISYIHLIINLFGLNIYTMLLFHFTVYVQLTPCAPENSSRFFFTDARWKTL